MGPELSRMFPAMGIPYPFGLECLRAIHSAAQRERLDDTGKMVVSYVDELVRSRGQFETLLRDFRAAEASWTTAAFEKTRSFLPDSCELGEIRYVFLPLGFDFRTDRRTVYMDPLAAVQYGPDGIRESLSHEFHHVARYRLTGENLSLMAPEEMRAPHHLPGVFREWASWLELEGIADCVSNAIQFDLPALRPAVERRRQQMADYGALLERSLARIRGDPGGRSPNPAEMVLLRKELLGLAHPVGARLAEEILTDLGRPALIECVGHPERFLRRYDTVARRRRLVGVDESLLGWLEGQ